MYGATIIDGSIQPFYYDGAEENGFAHKVSIFIRPIEGLFDALGL